MPNMSKEIIGLTGNIACGKSSVTHYLEAKGYQVIDADAITNELYEHSAAFKSALVNLFGDVILDENHNLSKPKVSKIVFEDQQLLEALNEIAHPIILKRVEQLIEKSDRKIIFVSAALLFEADWHHHVDQVILIKCDQNVQIARLMARNKLSNEQAQKRVTSQMAQAKKALQADYVIENSGSLAALYQRVDEVIKEIEKVK